MHAEAVKVVDERWLRRLVVVFGCPQGVVLAIADLYAMLDSK